MKLEEIVEFLDKNIPQELALDFDNVGFNRKYDLNRNIKSIKIHMDFLPEDDKYGEDILVITHHPPLFKPETPTFTIHSNWDIIDGGANEALAEKLNLDVISYFDDKTRIGRICSSDFTFKELKKIIFQNFDNARAVNKADDSKKMKRIGIISGFGLKNPEYISLSKEKKLDLLISGDLTHETAILAKNLNMTLIDLGHHESEVPGLYRLAEVLDDIDVDIEVIDKKPIEILK